MPDLPTLTVSQAHFDRLVAAFPGNTLAEKAQSYRDWLTNRLIERVQIVESRKIDEDSNKSKKIALDNLSASLPAPAPEPY